MKSVVSLGLLLFFAFTAKIVLAQESTADELHQIINEQTEEILIR